MKVYDTQGKLLTDIQLDAEAERQGQEILYVVDTDIHDLLEQNKRLLVAILRCLSSMSGLNITEEDTT